MPKRLPPACPTLRQTAETPSALTGRPSTFTEQPSTFAEQPSELSEVHAANPSVVQALSGALRMSRYVQPAVTDASARAMNWIKENAKDPDAVIASWEVMPEEQLREMGEAGHAAAMDKYSYQHLAKKFAELF